MLSVHFKNLRKGFQKGCTSTNAINTKKGFMTYISNEINHKGVDTITYSRDWKELFCLCFEYHVESDKLEIFFTDPNMNYESLATIENFLKKAWKYFLPKVTRTCSYCSEVKYKSEFPVDSVFCTECHELAAKDEQERLDCEASERAWMFRFEQ